MKAFMGLLMWSSLVPFSFFCDVPLGEQPEAVESAGEGVEMGVIKLDSRRWG